MKGDTYVSLFMLTTIERTNSSLVHINQLIGETDHGRLYRLFRQNRAI